MLATFDAAAAGAPASLRGEYARVRPAVVTYGDIARAIVAGDKARLDGFLTQFSALEKDLGAIDDAMLRAVEQADLTGRRAASKAAWFVVGGTVGHITRSSESTAEDANTTRASAERVSSAAGELEGLIGQFRY